MTYNDFRYTGLVFRTEQSMSTREPRVRLPPLLGARTGKLPNPKDFASENKADTMVWRSMIGFDWLKAFPWMPISRNDQWLMSGQLLTEYYAKTAGQMGNLLSPNDREQRWNNTVTFLGTGFFLGGKFRPTVAGAYEFNTKFPVMWLQGEYHVTPHLSVRVGTIQYMGSRFAQNHLFLHRFADRDTTYVRFIYNLL